jgi:hypothetical protein
MRGLAATAALGLVLAARASAQATPASGDHCTFSVDNVDRAIRQVPNPDGTSNYFAGGNVRLSCQRTSVRMASDSLAAFNNFQVTYFLGHVRYADSTVTMTADHGTYYKDGERWEARGDVVTRNTKNGSTLRGPSLDYLRPMAGIRDTAEMYATGRPRLEYVPTDSAGKAGEPYVIYGDRVRFRGDDRIFAGGSVTVDRSDFSARGDSLRLDTGVGQDGVLYGRARMAGKGESSFTLTGRRIDLRLRESALSGVRAIGAAHAVNPDWDLTADTIDLTLEHQKLARTLAWGDSLRPLAISPQREIRADSLAIDTPGQQLTEARAFGSAWIGGAVDSARHDRDQLWGDSVVARFTQVDSGGRAVTRISGVTARHLARSYHLLAPEAGCAQAPVSYVRGNEIVLTFETKGGGDLERVDVHGQVDGVQIEPECATADSLAADSARADTVVRRGVR